nr:hypothetical protein [Tanacetum cinerariifolium]
RTVLGQNAAGLAHEPHGRALGGFALGGAEEDIHHETGYRHQGKTQNSHHLVEVRGADEANANGHRARPRKHGHGQRRKADVVFVRAFFEGGRAHAVAVGTGRPGAIAGRAGRGSNPAAAAAQNGVVDTRVRLSAPPDSGRAAAKPAIAASARCPAARRASPPAH